METDRTSEGLQSALHSAAFAARDLRHALSTASPLAALVILPLIERAAALERDIRNLLHASMSDEGR